MNIEIDKELQELLAAHQDIMQRREELLDVSSSRSSRHYHYQKHIELEQLTKQHQAICLSITEALDYIVSKKV